MLLPSAAAGSFFSLVLILLSQKTQPLQGIPVGAFSLGVCTGMGLAEALHFASYAATITVSRAGAQPSLPTLGEVEALMKSQGSTCDGFMTR